MQSSSQQNTAFGILASASIFVYLLGVVQDPFLRLGRGVYLAVSYFFINFWGRLERVLTGWIFGGSMAKFPDKGGTRICAKRGPENWEPKAANGLKVGRHYLSMHLH
jgi:hypothetical protein